jgi:uncharacterized protein
MADNLTLVQQAYDGFSKGDVGPLLAILADDVEWYEAEHVTYWPGGAFRGPQAVLEGVLARIPQDFENFQINLGRLVTNGDTVLAEARYRATSVKATGKPLDAQVAHVWDFENGKVVHWQQYTDTWQFAQLTGVEHPM